LWIHLTSINLCDISPYWKYIHSLIIKFRQSWTSLSSSVDCGIIDSDAVSDPESETASFSTCKFKFYGNNFTYTSTVLQAISKVYFIISFQDFNCHGESTLKTVLNITQNIPHLRVAQTNTDISHQQTSALLHWPVHKMLEVSRTSKRTIMAQLLCSSIARNSWNTLNIITYLVSFCLITTVVVTYQVVFSMYINAGMFLWHCLQSQFRLKYINFSPL
jgi:hypothetical protein